jgi:hypothetical protein
MNWPWSRQTPDPLIDRLITKPVVKYAGHNEALARRTQQKRELEARAIAEAKRRLVEDAPSKIHLVSK